MKRVLLLLSLSFALLLLTCSPPPFNLAISESAKFAQQFAFVGQVGPIDPNTGNRGSPDIVFLPEKNGSGGISIDAGFVYTMDPGNGQNVSFIAKAGGSYVREGPPQFLGPLSSDPFPNLLVQSVKSITGNPHNVMVFQFNDANPLASQFGLITGDPSTGTFSPPPSNILWAQTVGDFGLVSDWVIGIGIYAASGNGFDRTYMLLADTNTGHYFEGRYRLSQTGNGLNGPNPNRTVEFDLVGLGVLPPAIPRVQYLYDPVSTYAFAMWNTG